jgi:hypothetical protein
MATSKKKTASRKRTSLKNLPAKTKEITKKDGKRVRGGSTRITYTVTGEKQ